MLKSELGIDVKLVRDICEPCVFGKAHRLPFGTRVKTTKPGHSDTTFKSYLVTTEQNLTVKRSNVFYHRTEFRRDWTAPYKPEQNGGSKLENRTIVEMARTFKYSNSEVELPDAIWAELVTSAIYILNRTGKSPKVGVSPHSL
jgi:hypothetical protein